MTIGEIIDDLTEEIEKHGVVMTTLQIIFIMALALAVIGVLVCLFILLPIQEIGIKWTIMAYGIFGTMFLPMLLIRQIGRYRRKTKDISKIEIVDDI